MHVSRSGVHLAVSFISKHIYSHESLVSKDNEGNHNNNNNNNNSNNNIIIINKVLMIY